MKKQILALTLFSFMALGGIALAESNCTINGQSVPCGDIGKGLAGFFGFGFAMFFVFLILCLALSIFWIMMLIHAASKPIENKLIWVLILIFTGLIGAVIYYFVVKRKFKEQAGQAPLPQNPQAN